MSQYGQNGIEHLDYGTLSRTLTGVYCLQMWKQKLVEDCMERTMALSGRILSFALLIMVAWVKSFYPSTNVKIDPCILE